ncbi:unnamed protein product [Amoebophrya sp. A120]|nr:unnamed protein product [Amoebophrya sp. A120]|eukprot:GSA120T00012318001.1
MLNTSLEKDTGCPAHKVGVGHRCEERKQGVGAGAQRGWICTSSCRQHAAFFQRPLALLAFFASPGAAQYFTKPKSSLSLLQDPQLRTKPSLDAVLRDKKTTKAVMQDFLYDKNHPVGSATARQLTRRQHAERVLEHFDERFEHATSPSSGVRISREQFESQMEKANLHGFSRTGSTGGEKQKTEGPSTGASILGIDIDLFDDFARKLRSGELQIGKDGVLDYDVSGGSGWSFLQLLFANGYSESVVFALNLLAIVFLFFIRKGQKEKEARAVRETYDQGNSSPVSAAPAGSRGGRTGVDEGSARRERQAGPVAKTTTSSRLQHLQELD